MKYSCEERGDGPPLLFLHGYGCSKEIFTSAMHSAEGYRHVIGVDLPGFGGTQMCRPYTLSDYVSFTADVINEKCGGRVDIVAHSFGGRIALKLAADYPESVGKMLLTGCAGIRPRRSAGYLVKTGIYGAARRLSPRLSIKIAKRIASPDYRLATPLMRESFKLVISEHLDGILPQVRAQTLLVFGRNDTETPLYMAEKLHKGIKDSGLVIFDGCGHFCFLDSPVLFNAVMEEFFK